MTYSPQRLKDEREAWQDETGLPSVSLGIQHFSTAGGGGYHKGNDLLAAIGRLDTDYSKRESARDRPGTDGASAIDIGWFDKNVQRVDGSWRRVTLIDYNIWLIAQLNAGAPDVAFVREVIYTLDRVTVRRWDRLGIRTTGDDSHLSHTHRSDFRDDENADKAAHVRRFWAEMRGITVMGVLTTEDASYGDLIFRVHDMIYGTTHKAPNTLHEKLDTIITNQNLLLAEAAADRTRDEGLAAAFQAFASQVSQGGGNIDVATIVNAVNAAASDTKTAMLEKFEEERERRRKAAQAEAIIEDDDPTNDPPV